MKTYAEDEYEDYNDYADEEQLEDAEEEEQKEDPRPTKEALEYLELRQKFKETLRKNMKKEGNSASQEKRRTSYDNFGSFFGPSKPVISQRVIQESKSFLENQLLASRVFQSHPNNKKSSSGSNGLRSGFHQQAPRMINQMQTKSQILKETRDYSFLFSEDSKLPATSKQPPTHNFSVPSSDAGPDQSLQRNHVSGSYAKQHSGNGDRRPFPSNSHSVYKPVLNKLPPTSKPSAAPLMSNKLQSRTPAEVPSKMLDKSSYSQVTKNSVSATSRAISGKMPSFATKHQVDARREVDEARRNLAPPKRPIASTKPQISRNLSQMPSRMSSQDLRIQKRPVRQFSDDDDDDGERAISMIRKMSGSNPQRFAGYEEDDGDMVANFDEIMEEEKRSARIARKEDEEQLRLIEEEERQEHMRKMAKKRKMSHS